MLKNKEITQLRIDNTDRTMAGERPHVTHSQWIFRNISLHDKINGYLHKKESEEIALELESVA